MQLPQIQVQSQQGRIQIRTTEAVQQIRQPEAGLHIEQLKADMQIRTAPGRLSIDQTQAWEEMDLMHISRRIEKLAQEGMQKASQGTARRAREGTELMQIENGGNPIASQAARNSHDPQKQLGIKFIPSNFSVKTNYTPSELNIDVQTNKPVIDATPRKAETTYRPGTVDTSMLQKPELEISFTNLFV